MSIEKIKIIKIGRKQQPSKFKPGETYSITTILDEKNRKLTAMGPWSENWKIGDEIEGTIEEKKWTDKDGFEQTNLNIKNPNSKQFVPRDTTNFLVISYQLAATLSSLLYANKKKVKLEDIVSLAEELRKKIEPSYSSTTETKEKEVPEIDVTKESKKAEDEDEDERPF